MDNDTALPTLYRFFYETCEPEVYWPRHWFDEISFKRWAAVELAEAIMNRPAVPAMDTIEEFAIKMAAYQVSADGTNAEKVFKYAVNFACEVLDIFREEYNS